MEDNLENLLEDFTLSELLEEGQLSETEALKLLYLGGHLDIHHLLPEDFDGLETDDVS